MHSSTLTFCGGAGSVTGANFLLDAGGERMLVDCGSRQGTHEKEEEAGALFPYDPKGIARLFVTHAHADHIGRIPELVRAGFHGGIFSTPATKDLAAIMFDDALSLMRQQVQERGGEAAYEREDVERALSLWQARDYRESFPAGDTTVRLFDAGHVLGSALVQLERAGRRILFTGDLGNVPEPLLRETEHPEGSHYIVMESVYGDRVHEHRDERREMLRAAIERARAQGGALIIPSFSIERTQVLLFEIHRFVEEGMEPLPVYLDAPLAQRVTDVYRRYSEDFNDEARAHLRAGDDPFAFTGLSISETSADSRAIHEQEGAKIIIAGAGMSVGGRIRAHERAYLSDPHTTVLFVGYQAPGSLGRRILEGQREVRIDGESVFVRARIESISGYSGHADRDGLLSFVEQTGGACERVFVAMGEPRSSLFLAQRIRDFYGLDAVVPREGQSYALEW